MSGGIYDNFTVAQLSGVTIPYSESNGSWGPPSERITFASSGYESVVTYNESLDYRGIDLAAPNSGTFNVIRYNYTSPFDIIMPGDIKVVLPVLSGGNVSYTLTLLIGEDLYTSASYDTTTSSFSFTPISNITSMFITVDVTTPGSSPEIVGAYPLTSTVAISCLAAGSKILTKEGKYKAIETLTRGEETSQGKIAQIIIEELTPKTLIELVSIPASSLGENLPSEDILACRDHIFIYRGKKTLAKDLPNVKLLNGRVEEFLPDNKLYDIQYDFEGRYTVSGLISQSRSPYCKLTPLPEELYFNHRNYKPFLVDNTLEES